MFKFLALTLVALVATAAADGCDGEYLSTLIAGVVNCQEQNPCTCAVNGMTEIQSNADCNELVEVAYEATMCSYGLNTCSYNQPITCDNAIVGRQPNSGCNMTAAGYCMAGAVYDGCILQGGNDTNVCECVKIGYDQCLTGSGCTDGPVAAVMYTLCTDEDCENDPDVEVECTAPHTDSTEGGSDGGSGGSGATSSAMGVVAALISLVTFFAMTKKQ